MGNQFSRRNDPNYVFIYPNGCNGYADYYPPQLVNVVTPEEWKRTITEINGMSQSLLYFVAAMFAVFFLGIILSSTVGGAGSLLFLVFFFGILFYICWYCKKKADVTATLNREIYGGGFYWHSSKHSKYIQIHNADL